MNQIQSLASELRRIPLINIRDASSPLREKYDEEALNELGDSLLNDKMIAPIIVESIGGDDYEVVIGSRRVRAARLKHVEDIPALVLEPQSQLDRLVLMLAENIHRVDLDPFEAGRAFLVLVREYGMEVGEIAKKVRKRNSWVIERIKLLTLPEETQTMVAEGRLAIGHAASLARVAHGEMQTHLAHEAVENRFSKDEFRRHIESEMGKATEAPIRAIPYQITPRKVVSKVDEIRLWFQRAAPNVSVQTFNLRERSMIQEAIETLERELFQFKKLIISTEKQRAAVHMPSHGGNFASLDAASNHGAEWTLRDIDRIMSDVRPSDDVLARELGRTTGAIRGMRQQMREKKQGN